MLTCKKVKAKRIFDIASALIGMLAFSPLLLAIMVLIVLEDGPPAVFAQERLGRHLRPFTLYKLRSMKGGRITRVGHWIRKTGLDEVLQFINVLNGSMSMVGPRPLTREDVGRLNLCDESLHRFLLRPGITGMAQLYAGRGIRVTCLLEQRYIEQQTICLDMAIVLLSLLVNIFGKRRIGGWLCSLRRRWRVRRSV